MGEGFCLRKLPICQLSSPLLWDSCIFLKLLCRHRRGDGNPTSRRKDLQSKGYLRSGTFGEKEQGETTGSGKEEALSILKQPPRYRSALAKRNCRLSKESLPFFCSWSLPWLACHWNSPALQTGFSKTLFHSFPAPNCSQLAGNRIFNRGSISFPLPPKNGKKKKLKNSKPYIHNLIQVF